MTDETIQFTRRETQDPVTGRRRVQLTHGEGFCYPLYYYGPSLTADGRRLIFYRYVDDSVQNWALDIRTGRADRLTSATTPNCLWRFWDEDAPASGVRDEMSAFCPTSGELLYFDDNRLEAVHVESGARRTVFVLCDDRVPCGVPGASPDGRSLAVVHADRGWWDASTEQGAPARHEARGVHLAVIDLHTGDIRTLVVANAWLTHAYFYDNERILFSNHPTECAVLLTDLRGGWYTHLRTQTEEGWVVNHCLATRRGLIYETVSPLPFGVVGTVDPDTFAARDFRTADPVSHIGHDPEGRLWFGDCYRVASPMERYLGWLPHLRSDALNAFAPLTGAMTTYGRGQRNHPHPVLLPDRRNILFTGPDPDSRTNHLFLLDVSDLADTETTICDTPPG